jgi:recombination protein RecA
MVKKNKEVQGTDVIESTESNDLTESTKDLVEDKLLAEQVEQLKALDKLLSSSCKGAYSGTYMKGNHQQVTYVPTGCPSLDKLLVGWPLGRVIECRGGFSSGKSTLSLFLIGAMQRAGYINMLIDAEAVYTEEYGQACGVDNNSLIYLRPNTMEDCIEAIRIGLNSGLIKFIWIDSLSALVPNNEVSKDVGEGTLAIRARLMSTYLPQIVNLCAKHAASVIWLNQERTTNIGGYGPSKSGTGGKALPYYASLILETSKDGYIEEGANKVGHNMKIKVTKSKLSAKPFTEVTLPINYPNSDKSVGVDVTQDVINQAVSLGIVEKRASWVLYKDIKEQGFTNFSNLIISNKELFEEIKTDVVHKLKNPE